MEFDNLTKTPPFLALFLSLVSKIRIGLFPLETQYKPDYALHPGEYLAEVLEARSISEVEFAERTGLAPKTINLILSGKSNFSTEVALVFERTLGISANLLIGLLENYQLFHASQVDSTVRASRQTAHLGE